MILCASCGEATPREDSACAQCGASVLLAGRYLLRAEVGSGALGQVFLATDTTDGSDVAVKKLPVHRAASEKARQLFDREAAVLRQLDHPRIPRYRDHFAEGKGFGRALYLVQDFVDGVTLAGELADRRYDEDGAIAVMAELLEVLAYLHRLSPPVIHRDIKPGNVIRRTDGSLALIDFGCVRDAVRDPALGGSTVAGTFGFMAPEQFRGDADARTDLYALGALAVALLSRKDPGALQGWDGRLEWEETIAVSPGLKALLADLLSPDPSDRPASAAEVGARLEGVLAGELPAPRAAAMPQRRNNTLPVVLAGTSIALLAGMGLAFTLFSSAAPMVATAPTDISIPAVPASPAAPAAPAVDPLAPPPIAEMGAAWPAQVQPQVIVAQDHLLVEFPRTGLDQVAWNEGASWELTLDVDGQPRTITYALRAAAAEMPLEERLMTGAYSVDGLSPGAQFDVAAQQDHLRLTLEDPALAEALRADGSPDVDLVWRGSAGESWNVEVEAARWSPARDMTPASPLTAPTVPASWADEAASCTASLIFDADGAEQVRVVGCPGELARAVVEAAKGWRFEVGPFGDSATTVIVDFPGDGTANIPQFGVGEGLVQILPVD